MQSGRPEMVKEWGRRLTSPQVTEMLAYLQLERDFTREAMQASTPSARAAARTPEDEEREMRAAFRAHNHRQRVA